MSVTNVGTRASSGTIVIHDKLPAGVLLAPGQHVTERHEYVPGVKAASESVPCPVREAALVVCEFGEPVPPEGVIVFQVRVTVPGVSPGVVANVVEVEEVGGVAPAVVSGPPETVANTVNGAASLFGIESFSSGVLGREGGGDAQAGDHPATSTTGIAWNILLNRNVDNSHYHFLPVGDPETQIVDLPPGLMGYPLALERCTTDEVYFTLNIPVNVRWIVVWVLWKCRMMVNRK